MRIVAWLQNMFKMTIIHFAHFPESSKDLRALLVITELGDKWQRPA